MLHDLKDTAVNVTTIAVTAGLGLAFLGALGVIAARETYMDWRGKRKARPIPKPKQWPARVRSTLLDEDEPKGLDVL